MTIQKLIEEKIEKFEIEFPGEVITYEDDMARIETRLVTVEAIKRFLRQALQDVAKASVEVELKNVWMDIEPPLFHVCFNHGQIQVQKYVTNATCKNCKSQLKREIGGDVEV